jgi:pyridoxal phosphate enzyme (YggS family)
VSISQNVRELIGEIPAGVHLVAAAKSREPREILEAINAGVRIIGENYVQEAEIARRETVTPAQWHFIGHLQKNKVKRAAEIFDMIETVDSSGIAAEIDRRCAATGKVMPVLVEINSGREAGKAGVYPEDAERLIREISAYKNIRVAGLMTMGPYTERVEVTRACYRETKRIFDHIKGLHIPNAEMQYLSMGMTDSYRTAIEEGANIVRIGTKIFGERPERPATS